MATPVVLIDVNDHGDLEFHLPETGRLVTCESIEDARNIAYLWAAHRRPYELVVRDAHHRVLRREKIGLPAHRAA